MMFLKKPDQFLIWLFLYFRLSVIYLDKQVNIGESIF